MLLRRWSVGGELGCLVAALRGRDVIEPLGRVAEGAVGHLEHRRGGGAEAVEAAQPVRDELLSRNVCEALVGSSTGHTLLGPPPLFDGLEGVLT